MVAIVMPGVITLEGKDSEGMVLINQRSRAVSFSMVNPAQFLFEVLALGADFRKGKQT